MTQRAGGRLPAITVYRGWLHCMTTIVREEGFTALWKGTVPRLVWVGASSAIWYGTYQAVRQGLSRPKEYSSHALVGIKLPLTTQ